MNFLCLITLDFKNSTVTDQSWNLRGTCPDDVLRNFTKFTGKLLCQSIFFKKNFRSRPATLFKKYSGTGVFL